MRVVIAAAFLATALAWAREGPQPPLPEIVLSIGGKKVIAEVADEEHEREAGLMFREKLEDGRGMLFVMPAAGSAGFWMKNTSIPLSIAYISPQGRILEIHDMEPGDERVVRSRFRNIAYALEVRQGWFSDAGIFAGDMVTGLPEPAPR